MVLNGCSARSGRGRPRCRVGTGEAAGFTLLEVLIAMVVLSVGLLALQALNTAAVVSAASAEWNTRAAFTASRYLEDAIEQLRRGRVPPSFTCTLDSGDQISRSVSAGTGSRLAVVSVEVVPDARGLPAQPYSIHAHAYSPHGFELAASSFTCP